MMLKAILLATLLISTVYGAQWAVLVAGSNGWSNYRHQSDVCHSYQILISNGVPASNIIVMAYNDIADNKKNPFPGTLFNKPTGTLAGDNVYAGCVIDYQEKAVTPDNFAAVLTGNKAGLTGGNGRVLESTAEDTVFVYFSDHGSPGLIAFPTQYMYAKQLQDAWNTMFAQKMYKQLTFYLETCESGSMFQNILPNNMSIYAVSAANPTESSWATYCPPQDQVNGKHIGSCLGDEFSVNWMENTMANNPSTFTLQDQFAAVKTLTLGSEVMQWGDLTFTSEPIGVFQGNGQSSNKFLKKVMGFFKDFQGGMTKISQDQRDVEVNYLLSQFNSDVTDDDVYEKLVWELTTTRRYTKVFQKFTAKYQISGVYFGSTDFECYESLIGKVQAQCGKLNDQATRHLKYLYQYCASYSEWQNAVFEC